LIWDDACGAGQNLQNKQNFSLVDYWSLEFGISFPLTDNYSSVMRSGFAAFPDNLITHIPAIKLL